MSTSAALTRLHDHYVEAVNIAVAHDDEAGIDRLVREYDLEVLEVVRRQLAA